MGSAMGRRRGNSGHLQQLVLVEEILTEIALLLLVDPVK